TRFKCDWSSDVCSSDLKERRAAGQKEIRSKPLIMLGSHSKEQGHGRREQADRQSCPASATFGVARGGGTCLHLGSRYVLVKRARSEERRVGKECRGRW